METEIRRKIVHALGVFSIVAIYVLDKWYAALFMLSISVALLFSGEYRKNKEKYKIIRQKHLDEFEEIMEDEVKKYERENELPFQGAIMFYFGAFLTTALFSSYIAIASIAVLALADSMSTLVGKFLGKHKTIINRKKTYEGSTAFFLIAAAVLVFFMEPLKAFAIAAIVTVVEMAPRVDDNITIPLATGLLMLLLQ